MKATDFGFHLPESLIALKPSAPRDSSRLLLLRKDGCIEHKRFSDLPEYLDKGDMLMFNNTKVFPARLTGRKQTGGKISLLATKKTGPDTWEILTRTRYTGRISISDNLYAEITGGKSMQLSAAASCGNRPSNDMELLWEAGQMPLPPYIKREPSESDKQWYQTVYAEKTGSIAAPTAGLHFTKELIGKLRDKGVRINFVTLHIGTGTFKPIRTECIEDHVMDNEYFEIEASVLDAIEKVKDAGKRVVSVGTTTARALEGFASGRWSETETIEDSGFNAQELEKTENRNPKSKIIKGRTGIFIHPGYRFRVIDALITNFHLPASTPLMLTSAMGGRENVMRAYREAVSMKYRFFSYGDAMLIA